jgi:hypothetical protein
VLLSKEQAGLVQGRPVIEPSECKPGEAVKITVQMRRNADDPRAPARPPGEQATGARLSVLLWRPAGSSTGTTSTTNFDLPAEWAHLAVGQTVSNTVTLAAPLMPGNYTIRLQCTMTGAGGQPAESNLRTCFSFGMLDVR